ncbi:PIN/TRAM domain-containing protein [Aminomonas paucivorans]|uniref:PIN/TRAM domain-containing protein n=1 Tax=Aminomonas paucivorans TaxID=81412 RepID=UPI00331BB2BB
MAESGMVRIVRGTLRSLLTLLGGVAGYQIAQFIIRESWWPQITQPHPVGWISLCVVLFGLFGFILSPLFWLGLGKFGQLFETHLQTVGLPEIFVSLLGLILGLLVANLIALPMADIPGVGVYVAVLLNVSLGYLGVRLCVRRREDIWTFLSSVGGIRERLPFKGRRREKGTAKEDPREDGEIEAPERQVPKILDTSVIIDGRLLDVATTGFLEGPLLLPRFVLSELQAVADSTDPVRRTRGRRGLDVVNDLQKIPGLVLEIREVTLKSLGRDVVDEALVVLAKRLQGKVLTTDYNLNKIAQIDGVPVLNVNDLANALKPMLLPGEAVSVDIIREGKEPHQGVGYLDDGTMIVVEEGERFIGRRVDVVVTSMLQTSAGRMVFGRLRRERP